MNSHSLCIAAATTADYFGDLAKALGEGVKKNPGLSGICLVVLIAATVFLMKGEKKLRGFFILLALAIVMIAGLTAAEIYKGKAIYGTGPTDVKTTPDSAPKTPLLASNQKQDIKIVLRKAAEEVADVLKIAPKLLRANLFAPDEHERMRIVPGLSHNMHSPEELTISIPVGYGSTGRCFRSGKPNIAVFREDWGAARLADEELRKLDPDLRWIISVPVNGATDEAQPICVMNIDCLTELRNETELESALSHLYSWSFMISKILSQSEEPISRNRVDPSITASETTAIQVHSLINNIKTKDIAYPSEHFLKSTSELTSVPALNSFTQDAFNKQVQEHFVSYKPPQ